MVRQPDKAPTQRQLRVGEELRHTLALALERGEVHDPALDGRVVTVTEVRVSPDLKNATVFVLPLGGGGADETVTALNRAAGFLRGWVGRHVRLRYMPRLTFVGDTSFDHADAIDGVLHDPRVLQDIVSSSDPEDKD